MIFYSFQQDGRPTILSQMESSSEQFVEGVFPTFRQWAIHRCAFGHWKQKYPVSQSGIISLFQLLWTSLLDFWWEKSNHHPKGYLLWWYLGLSRVHVPWRNQCRPGKLQQAYCLDIFYSYFSKFIFEGKILEFWRSNSCFFNIISRKSKFIFNLDFFQKFRQIEERSVLLSYNVNKFLRFFRTILRFENVLGIWVLNSKLKAILLLWYLKLIFYCTFGIRPEAW